MIFMHFILLPPEHQHYQITTWGQCRGHNRALVQKENPFLWKLYTVQAKLFNDKSTMILLWWPIPNNSILTRETIDWWREILIDTKTYTYISHLSIGHVKSLFHKMIRLTYQLHVSILNAVVNHFNKVSSTFRTNLYNNNNNNNIINNNIDNNNNLDIDYNNNNIYDNNMGRTSATKYGKP